MVLLRVCDSVSGIYLWVLVDLSSNNSCFTERVRPYQSLGRTNTGSPAPAITPVDECSTDTMTPVAPKALIDPEQNTEGQEEACFALDSLEDCNPSSSVMQLEDMLALDLNSFTKPISYNFTLRCWQPSPMDYDCSFQSQPIVAKDEEKWFVSDEAYSQGLESARIAFHEFGPPDPNVPFQAILWGWDMVDKKQYNHSLWKALREVDERVFGAWTSKAQKIAMMFVCQTLMQVSNASRVLHRL